MAETAGTLAKVLRLLVNALTPLDDALSVPPKTISFAATIGLGVPNAPPSLLALHPKVSNLRIALSNFESAVTANGEDSPEALTKLGLLAVAAAELYQAISTLGPGLRTDLNIYADFPAEIDPTDVAKRVFAYCLISYVREAQPALYNALRFCGIFVVETESKGGQYAPAHTRYVFRDDRLRSLLKDPYSVFNEVYGWGSANFDESTLIHRLQYLLTSLGFVPSVYVADGDGAGAAGSRELRLSLYSASEETGLVDVSVALGRLAATAAGTDAGLSLRPVVTGSAALEFDLISGLTAQLSGDFSAAGGVELRFRPPANASLVKDLAAASAAAHFGGTLEWRSADGDRPTILSQPGLLLLDFGGLSLKLIVDAQAATSTIVAVELGILDGKLQIGIGSSDGFLTKVLPGGVSASFEVIIGWGTDRGMYFSGSGALDLTLPIHAELGPLTIDFLHILLGARSDALDIGLAVTASAKLGPVAASVTRVGAEIPVSFPADGGNVGPLQVNTPRFLYPTGVSLGLNSSGITGGGFLFIDKPTYAGGLQLRFSELGLTAVGIITTELPGGRKGFALLISIAVEFSPAIPLSFGFTLGGVGGLIAINHTMSVDALQTGLRNHALDSVLFPEDIVLNAAKIISDLQAIFPVQEGRYILGPMVRIFWGSPPLIVADIAILIEIPSPIRLVLLGQIVAQLPKPEKVLVDLHLDIMGVLDFDKKSLAIDATIYGTIVSYPLSGDAALRLTWGDNPQFAMSLGGFHPRFSPPPKFPDLRRLKLELSSSSAFEISCSTYNALTSNSLQFGARVDLYGEESGASVEGRVSFDALIYFSPFHFTVDMGADVVARYKGHRVASVSLSLSLSGPQPWHAKGKASFSVLCWDVTARFNKTWGKDDEVTIPAVDPWVPFQEELARSASWSAALPVGREMVEALRSIEGANAADGDQPLILHPIGALEIRQKLLPLGVRIDTLGNAPVTGHDELSIARVETIETVDSVETPTPVLTVPVKDYFARGQFEEMSESRKLSVPSFEKMAAGVAAAVDGPRLDGDVVPCGLEYESVLLDPRGVASEPVQASTDWGAAERAVSAGAARRNRPSLRGRGRFGTRGRPKSVDVDEDGYVVVHVADLTPADEAVAPPRMNDGTMTKMEADQSLQLYLEAHTEEAGSLFVICATEAAQPAGV